jgi:MFS family permease
VTINLVETGGIAPAVPALIQPLSTGARRYALGLLFLLAVVNAADRQIVNILAEDIRHELGLRDWQIGMMTGLAFSILYSTVGLPIARLAERSDRPRIIAVAIVVWSGFTAVCGLAQTFVQFALGRVGVGVGEAGCAPPGHSLISDYVPRAKRASALAFFSMGGPVGGLAGMATGGLVADVWGWRAAFMVVAIPGVVLGLVTALTLSEPRRATKFRGLASATPKLADAFRELAACRTYVLFGLGSVIMSVVVSGHAAFVGSFFLRNHAAGLSEMAAPLKLQATGFLGLAVGLISGVGGVLGALIGGQIADRAASKSPKAYSTLAAWAAFVSLPTFIAAMLVPSTPWALGLLFLPNLTWNMAVGSIYAVPQSVVRPQLRATAIAVVFFFGNLLGTGLGPLLVGLSSDRMQASGMTDGEAIRVAQIVATLVGLVAVWAYWRAGKYIEADMVG